MMRIPSNSEEGIPFDVAEVVSIFSERETNSLTTPCAFRNGETFWAAKNNIF